MFGASVEQVKEIVEMTVNSMSNVYALREKLSELQRKIFELEREKAYQDRESEISKQEAITKLRGEMQKSLVESDLLRQEAVAKLTVYEQVDTKSDANCIKDMIKQLIDKIGAQQVNVVK
jgi:hypothetical protein